MSSEHQIELANGQVTKEPCKAAKDCFLWATHIVSWVQIAGNGKGEEKVHRRIRKPVCRRHAEKFAGQYGLRVPETVAQR